MQRASAGAVISGRATMAEFDTFSPAAQRAVQFARAAAERLNHDSIGTEHLLLGVVEERDELAVYILNLLGVRLKRLVDMVIAFVDQGEPFIGALKLTERARTALEIAEEERRRLGHVQVRTVHLLTGLLDQPECTAFRILKRMELDVDDLAVLFRSLDEPDNGRSAMGSVLERLREARLERGDLEKARVHVAVSEAEMTGQATLIMRLARQGAWIMGHDSIGTDHLLHALLAKRDNAAAQVLTGMGLTEKRLLLAVRCARGLHRVDLPNSAALPFSPRAQNALALARYSAQRAAESEGRGHLQRPAGWLHKRIPVESGDLLIGLLDEEHGGAVAILESFEIDHDEIRARLRARARWRPMAVRPKPPEPATLWEWANQQLIERQWSLSDLARESGISRTRLRSWLRGRSRPSGASCDALAAAVLANPNVVRRLADRPGIAAAIAPPPEAGSTSAGDSEIEAMRALIDQVHWDEGRIVWMTGLLETMLRIDQETRHGRKSSERRHNEA
jgi:ATP-dependent Clp protease ATP-binding subunit ClpA